MVLAKHLIKAAALPRLGVPESHCASCWANKVLVAIQWLSQPWRISQHASLPSVHIFSVSQLDITQFHYVSGAVNPPGILFWRTGIELKVQVRCVKCVPRERSRWPRVSICSTRSLEFHWLISSRMAVFPSITSGNKETNTFAVYTSLQHCFANGALIKSLCRKS